MKLRGLFLLSLLASTANSYAQETLPPVVVSSTRLRDVDQPLNQIPGKVIVVTAEEIQQLGARTVQEVLQYQTGVVLYDLNGNEFQQSVDLRGFNGLAVPATSVFVDGVRVNEPDFNAINFDLIPIEFIERIEIMPGTATVFGRNALGGVINITTKRGRSDRPHFEFDLGGGSYGRQKYSFKTDGPLPFTNLDYYLGVTRELTDGFREASGGRITRVLSKLGYRLSDSTDATLSYTHVLDHLKQAGATFASRLRVDRNDNLTPGDFFAGDLHLVTLNVRQKLPAGFSVAVNGFVRNNDADSFIKGLFSVSTQKTDTLSAGTTVQATHDGTILGKKNILNFGAEYSKNRIVAKNFGMFTGCPPFLTKKNTDEDVVGLYVSDSISIFESLVLVGGFRYDWDRLDFTGSLNDPCSFPAPVPLRGVPSFHRVSPKAGLVFAPLKDLSFSFTYSEGIRTPTTDEMFAFGPFGSNPNLTPMKSKNFEIGAKAAVHDWLDASLALFYTPVRDEIVLFVTDPDTFFGRNENISKTLRRGLELSLKARYQKWLDAFFNYTVTKATFETDFLLFSGQVRKGDELPLVPQHRVSAGINVHPLDGLTLSLLGNFVGSQFLNNDEPNDAKKLASYFVLGSRAAYEWKNWTAHVTVNNLTDRRYSTYGFQAPDPLRVPAPGVNVFAGLSFRY